VWLPELAPSPALVKAALAAKDDRQWAGVSRRYRAEMKRPEAARLLDLLAALSRQTHLAIGCYCQEEGRCHRSLLRQLLAERGAVLA
jgi:uncharacterized protein YeaO (DUF488 family)